MTSDRSTRGKKKTGRAKSKGSKKTGGKGFKGRSRVAPQPDPSDSEDTEVRFVQPYQATKSYLCPGCGRTIVEGQGHMVAVPRDAPDLRRHWHRGCWVNRKTRY